MGLPIQKIPTDKTVRNDTIKDLKDFNNQSLTTQAKKGEHWSLGCQPLKRHLT